MPAEIRVPVLGESVVEATVARWLKQEGDPVTVGEPLVELETDKVNVEVSADGSGVLERILRGQGATGRPGDPLGAIAEGDGAAAPAAPARTQPAATPKAEAPKAEAPKAEAPKAEAPKAEAPKAEAPKAEARPPQSDGGAPR